MDNPSDLYVAPEPEPEEPLEQPTADPQTVLAAAQAAGPVERFAVEQPRLSELFLEAVAA